jgi:hypothetical protein
MNSFNGPAVSSQSPVSQAPQEMQSSQEWRKAAYNSLMNNPNAQPVFANQQAQMANSPPGMSAAQQPTMGQSGWTGANGQPMPPAYQSQTLSGQVQQQPTYKKGSTSKLSGLAHAASMATMFGSGAMVGALMMSRSPGYGIYSSGMMGASLVNYGLRVPMTMW